MSKLKNKNIKLTKCYLVEAIDNNGKSYNSDFCFGTKVDAEKCGEKLLSNSIVPNRDCSDITYKIEQIQSSIRELQNLIKRSYNGKLTDGKQLMCDAVIADADNAYESLEQVKTVCDVLSDAYVQ